MEKNFIIKENNFTGTKFFYLSEFIENFGFSENNKSDWVNLNLQFYLIVFDIFTFICFFSSPLITVDIITEKDL